MKFHIHRGVFNSSFHENQTACSSSVYTHQPSSSVVEWPPLLMLDLLRHHHHHPPLLHPAKRINGKEEKNSRILQEVLATTATTCGNSALVIWHGREDLKLGLEVLAQVHNGRDVATAVAVVGC